MGKAFLTSAGEPSQTGQISQLRILWGKNRMNSQSHARLLLGCVAFFVGSLLFANGQPMLSLQDVQSHYNQAQLAKDESMREKYIIELINLRARLVAAKSDDWKAVDAEIIRHPTPANSDSKSLSKTLEGLWQSPRHNYLFRSDGTWKMVESVVPETNTWSIHGNQLHEDFGTPPRSTVYTIILIDADYFVMTNGTQVFIQKRLPQPKQQL